MFFRDPLMPQPAPKPYPLRAGNRVFTKTICCRFARTGERWRGGHRRRNRHEAMAVFESTRSKSPRGTGVPPKARCGRAPGLVRAIAKAGRENWGPNNVPLESMDFFSNGNDSKCRIPVQYTN